MSQKHEKWFQRLTINNSAQVQLFCFTYAGGSASNFIPISKLLSSNIEVIAIQLPGRASRFVEPAYTCMTKLVDDLVPAFMEFNSKPYAVLGHSLGARIGFQLVNALYERGYAQPQHFFASGSRGPDCKSLYTNIFELPDKAFVEKITRLGGIPSAVLENKELMELITPLLKADFQLADTYRYLGQSEFSCPITTFSGTKDEGIQEADVDTWGNYFTGDYQHFTINGGHFFIDSNPSTIVDVINNEIGTRELINLGTESNIL